MVRRRRDHRTRWLLVVVLRPAPLAAGRGGPGGDGRWRVVDVTIGRVGHRWSCSAPPLSPPPDEHDPQGDVR
jgi:hypothetical protein